MKSLTRTAFLLIGTLVALFAAAQHEGHAASDHAHDTHSEHAKEPFKPADMILGHVVDEHGWHLWGHTSLPLPIIAYNTERGLSCFSSARFDHGHVAYGGYLLHEGKLKATKAADGTHASAEIVDHALTQATYDISITKNVLAMLVSMLLMVVAFLAVAKAYRNNGVRAPKGLLARFVEPVVLFVRDDVAKANIGPGYERFLPFLLTVFFFILINNLMGLIPIFPGGANVTGSISIALTLAAFTFALILLNGNKHYWGHILAMPGVPKLVLLILTPVEILGVFLRPAVLMIRLFANITAGHIIVLSFFALIFIFGEMSQGLGYGVAIFSLMFTVFMTMLELLVAFIQAFVFTFLAAMYFGSAIEGSHDHH